MKYGGLSSAESFVFPVQDKMGSQDLIICERCRNLLLNWCVWKEGAGGLRRVALRRKHAEYVLSDEKSFLVLQRVTESS